MVGDGREGGWPGDGKARKRSPEGSRECGKEADAGKGSREKETIRKIGHGLGQKTSLRKAYGTQTEANDEERGSSSTVRQKSRRPQQVSMNTEVSRSMLSVDREVGDKCDVTDDAAEKTETAAMKLEKAREKTP